MDGLPGMKKRASFQIPPTYGDKKPNDEFSLIKAQKDKQYNLVKESKSFGIIKKLS